MSYIESQFGNPRGLFGHIAGLIMAYENRERNLWALSLLDIQPEDRLLEIGFGPGWTIEQASKLTYKGLVAGVDRSITMVRQAGLRNRASVRIGRVLLRQGFAAQIPFDDAMFHKAYAVNSFHEWDDAVGGLKEVERLLHPGGVLLIVEHPHDGNTESGLQQLQTSIAEKVSKAGFINIRFVDNRFQNRAAVAVRGTKSL